MVKGPIGVTNPAHAYITCLTLVHAGLTLVHAGLTLVHAYITLAPAHITLAHTNTTPSHTSITLAYIPSEFGTVATYTKGRAVS
jgi:hypothetical protein